MLSIRGRRHDFDPVVGRGREPVAQAAVDCGSELECSCVICAHEHAGPIDGRCCEGLKCGPHPGFAVVTLQVLGFDGCHNGESRIELEE